MSNFCWDVRTKYEVNSRDHTFIVVILYALETCYVDCRYFKNTLNIICEFIPQVIFLTFLFLYMVLMMFMKWIIYFATDDGKLTGVVS